MAVVKLSPAQSKVGRYIFSKPSTAATVVASRGFGKTYLACTAAVKAVQELLNMPADLPNKNVSIVAPTHSQAVDIYYPLLTSVFRLDKFAKKESQALGRFWFRNGVELKLWSAEALERMRGTGQYCVVLDEVTSWSKMAFKSGLSDIIEPSILTRWPNQNRLLIISTPKHYDHFYECTLLGEKDPKWQNFHYTYRSAPHLSREIIDAARLNTDPLTFAREYEASFEDSGANVFYMFDRKKHVVKGLLPFQEGETVYCGIDFNVTIQATSMFAIRNGRMEFIDEMQGHPDTASLARALKARYPKFKIVAFPDPSGRARKTSAPVGVTDFSILEAAGITCLAKSSHPAIVDSVAAVNRMLEDANGNICMLFDTNKCPNTIKSVERTVWVEGKSDSAMIDKSEGIEHWGDGVRYATEYLFPIKNNMATSIRGFQF